MPTFAESAIAAHTASMTSRRDALVAAARATVVTLFTEGGRLMFDPKAFTVAHVDPVNSIVVLATFPDVPPSHLWVKGSVVKFARLEDGAWVTHRADRTPYPELKSFTDAGAVLAAG